MSIKDDQTSLFLLKKKIIDKSRLFQSTTASNEAFYAKAMLHILSGMPTMFKECITLSNGKCKTVMLHYNSFLNILLFQVNTA